MKPKIGEVYRISRAEWRGQKGIIVRNDIRDTNGIENLVAFAPLDPEFTSDHLEYFSVGSFARIAYGSLEEV